MSCDAADESLKKGISIYTTLYATLSILLQRVGDVDNYRS